MSVPAESPKTDLTRDASAPVGIGSVCVTWKLERARSVAEPGPLELRWSLSSSGLSQAELISAVGGARALESVEAPARFGFDAQRRMLHIDLDADGASRCSVTLDVSGARPRLLYARTALIAELGVAGGCVEISSVKTS